MENTLSGVCFGCMCVNIYKIWYYILYGPALKKDMATHSTCTILYRIDVRKMGACHSSFNLVECDCDHGTEYESFVSID